MIEKTLIEVAEAKDELLSFSADSNPSGSRTRQLNAGPVTSLSLPWTEDKYLPEESI